MTGPAHTGRDEATPTGPGGATGHPRVDEALAGLADVADSPPQQQVEPLARAHAVLNETLDTIGDV